jgi:hypothetical protein
MGVEFHLASVAYFWRICSSDFKKDLPFTLYVTCGHGLYALFALLYADAQTRKEDSSLWIWLASISLP